MGASRIVLAWRPDQRPSHMVTDDRGDFQFERVIPAGDFVHLIAPL